MEHRVTVIKRSGQRLENVAATVQPRIVFFDDGCLPIEEGDQVERRLPNGLAELYEIIERGYYDRPYPHGHYQSKVRKLTTSQLATSHSVVYSVSGDNARININSTDGSTNVVSVPPQQLFQQLRESIATQVADERKREELQARVQALENAAGTPSYAQMYQQLLAIAADHMSVLVPFLPALSQLLQP